MAYHPLNLGLRFGLEIVGLAAFGFWGWSQGGWLGWLLAAVLVIAAAAIWAVFRTPGGEYADANEPIVRVPGPVRLLIELLFFWLAVVALSTANASDRADTVAIIFAILVVIHYALSWDRNAWLWRTR